MVLDSVWFVEIRPSPSFPSFSLPDVLCDPTDLIWRKGTLFEVMTGRTAPSSDGLLAEVVLSCKENARRSVHHFIITIIISDQRDTWDKLHFTRNLDRSWWHGHTSLKLVWPQPMVPWTGKPLTFFTRGLLLCDQTNIPCPLTSYCDISPTHPWFKQLSANHLSSWPL